MSRRVISLKGDGKDDIALVIEDEWIHVEGTTPGGEAFKSMAIPLATLGANRPPGPYPPGIQFRA